MAWLCTWSYRQWVVLWRITLVFTAEFWKYFWTWPIFLMSFLIPIELKSFLSLQSIIPNNVVMHSTKELSSKLNLMVNSGSELLSSGPQSIHIQNGWSDPSRHSFYDAEQALLLLHLCDQLLYAIKPGVEFNYVPLIILATQNPIKATAINHLGPKKAHY